ncbi:two-component system sensor protein [Alishewanella aestuarii B11]|uniref:Two-component system sensor protein n=1 Tax=Alishewanella aestuarii B11 TaxID=1197174 RepID=J2IG95_9ALTE|nr:histidine kinase [Alishewanella aestuarii]EJI85789.1 two-component system sensor protein [Alishewanella aestuarii B11]
MKLRFPLATLAGVITWLLVSGITLLLLQRLPSPQPMLAASLLLLLYGVCFVFLTQEQHPLGLTGRYGRLLLLTALVAAFTLQWVLPTGYFDYLAILTVIWVSLLPHIMSQQKAMILTALIVILWFSLQAYLEQRSLWISAALYGSFHLFAVLMQTAIKAETEARAELTEKHRQLLAAQQLLQLASRAEERNRIARDLHDLLGHHLTALTIQLQVASYQCDGEAKLQVEKSLQLARLLLSDVREAVSAMRDSSELDLKQLFAPLLQHLPDSLQVELDIAPKLKASSLNQAQHLQYLVQEAISNTLKHANASCLWIHAREAEQGIALEIKDNGQLKANWQPGNGLIGMRERVAECGGKLHLAADAGSLALQIWLPQAGVADV